MSEKKATLFELFREIDTRTITDGKHSVTISIRPLEWAENLELIEKMDESRAVAAKRYDTPHYRDALRADIAALTKGQLIDRIIDVERPVAVDNADLAITTPRAPEAGEDDDVERPGEPTDAFTPPAALREILTLVDELQAATLSDPLAAKVTATKDRIRAIADDQEKKIVARWEQERRSWLQDQDEEMLRGLIVDRMVRNIINNRANDRMFEVSLARMVVDPDTMAPLFSDDPEAPNYVGRLVGVTRTLLQGVWADYTRTTSDKQLRQLAQSSAFLPPGASRNGQVDTPGATTVTPSDSRRESSSSTPSVAG